MLYPTFNQPVLILMVALVGLLSGLLFDFVNFLIFTFKNKKIIGQILYLFAMAISFLSLFFINLKINFGNFRLFILLEFIFFLILERFTLGIMWTKALKKCYTKLKPLTERIRSWKQRKKKKQ